MAHLAPRRRPGGRSDRHLSVRSSSLHGSATLEQEDGPTVRFMIDGQDYVLTGELAERLRETLAPYVAAGRPRTT